MHLNVSPSKLHPKFLFYWGGGGGKGARPRANSCSGQGYGFFWPLKNLKKLFFTICNLKPILKDDEAFGMRLVVVELLFFNE